MAMSLLEANTAAIRGPSINRYMSNESREIMPLMKVSDSRCLVVTVSVKSNAYVQSSASDH